jgi:hypothetical protein
MQQQQFALPAVPWDLADLPRLQSDRVFRSDGYRFTASVVKSGCIKVSARSRDDLLEFIAEFVVSYDLAKITQAERDASLAELMATVVSS